MEQPASGAAARADGAGRLPPRRWGVGYGRRPEGRSAERGLLRMPATLNRTSMITSPSRSNCTSEDSSLCVPITISTCWIAALTFLDTHAASRGCPAGSYAFTIRRSEANVRRLTGGRETVVHVAAIKKRQPEIEAAVAADLPGEVVERKVAGVTE
jgi:hypothetical protein